jgi:organic radical activating enzyme
MKPLVIYPSLLCPFACAFCYNKNKNSYNRYLDISVIKEFIKNHSDKISDIIISGGEPMSFSKSYFDELINTLKTFDKSITVRSYPYTLSNFREDVNYNFSFDFMARPRALEAWENLLALKYPFNMTVLISPVIFKYHPNDMLKRLSVLPNLKKVEFIPYYKNEYSAYDITKNDCLIKFNKILLQSKLNLPYELINRSKIQHKIVNNTNDTIEVCLLPDGNLYYQDFDDNNILKFIPTTDEIFDKEKYIKYPNDIDLYSDEIIKWFKQNGN